MTFEKRTRLLLLDNSGKRIPRRQARKLTRDIERGKKYRKKFKRNLYSMTAYRGMKL